ncbi:MAG: zinc ribbon domain-containing protein [Candidatus Heimdallarchaeum aukensis]|uniref:Zinc ribbon domain-containing protein n=1 Tax=Candidatus Heimdallarchaeum aukensis TaxID=2876573 RepID=A0A9Y1FLT7_9ARCH|nr:MAG: zinc ribbon domain-containing protein [Candidatus Heimdallarchaeum aukensis]
MITLNARKHITLSTFVYVAIIILQTFVEAFVSYKIIFIHVLPDFLSQIALIWVGVGFFLFNKEEKKVSINQLVVFLAIYGIISSSLILLSYIDFKFNFLSDKMVLALQIVYVVNSSFLIYCSIIIQDITEQHVKNKRNIIQLTWSFTIGFVLLFIYNLLNVIFPPMKYVINSTSENAISFFILSPPKIYYLVGTLNQDFKTIFFVLSIVEVSYLVFIVIGIWKLRKIFLLLDNIPPELINKLLTRKEEPSFVLESLEEKKLYPPSLTTEQQDKAVKKKMFCIKCGVELDPDALFCEECGERNPYRVNDVD